MLRHQPTVLGGARRRRGRSGANARAGGAAAAERRRLTDEPRPAITRRHRPLGSLGRTGLGGTDLSGQAGAPCSWPSTSATPRPSSVCSARTTTATGAAAEPGRAPASANEASSTTGASPRIAERTADELALHGAGVPRLPRVLLRRGDRRHRHLVGRAPRHRGVPGDDREVLRLQAGGARARASRRACRSSPRTRARSVPTASPTRSPRSTSIGGPVVVIDFGTATTYDAVSATGEYLGGVDRSGHRDQPRRALHPGGRAATGRAGRAPQRHRTHDRRVDPVGRRLRLRRPGRRHLPPAGRRAGRSRRSWPPAAWPASSRRTPRSIQHVEPWLTLHGLRLVFEKNQADRGAPVSRTR